MQNFGKDSRTEVEGLTDTFWAAVTPFGGASVSSMA